MKTITTNIYQWLTELLLKLFIGILLLMLIACANESLFDDMTCAISTLEQGECQSIPTLHTGALYLKRNGSFELNGIYMSCFQSSNVHISGQFQYRATPKQIIEMELSAEEIVQDGDQKIKFPRTIGVINLDQSTGQGNFIDIWSNIRMKGLVKQENIAKKLQCKST